MEQPPHEPEGSAIEQPTDAAAVASDAGRRAQLIEYGIETAASEKVVDEWVVSLIAGSRGN